MLQKSWVLLTVLAAILVAAPTVQAGFEGPDDVRVPPVSPPEEPEGPAAPPAPESPPRLSSFDLPDELKPTAGEADQAMGQAWDRIQNTRTWAEDKLNVERLRDDVDAALSPIHGTAGQVERQVAEVLGSENTEPESEASPAPASQANIVADWPSMSGPILIMAGTAFGLGAILWFLGQTATVGAGAAGTAAADGRRFLPFASPMFTRFEKDTVLGHPKREAIYGEIIGKPGVTLQDLCETTGLSRTAVTHHLRLMEQQHLIVSKRMGRSRHFFENGGRYGRHQKAAFAVLHNERSKEIHDHILANPGAIQKDLCGQFEIQASVAHWHVKRLLEAGLIEAVRQGRTVSYYGAQRVGAPAFDAAPAPMAGVAT